MNQFLKESPLDVWLQFQKIRHTRHKTKRYTMFLGFMEECFRSSSGQGIPEDFPDVPC